MPRIKPTLEVEGDQTTVTLKIEGEQERLMTWDVVDRGQPLSPLMESHNAGGKEQGKMYPAPLPETCSL